MQTVLVATDLSARSDTALKRAVSIAQRAGAKLHVVHVVDEELPDAMAEAQREGAERFVRTQIAAINGAQQLETQVSAVSGDPCDSIVATATKVGADILVMGRHRHRGLAEFFSGTTVERIARITTLPLLVASRTPDGPYARAVVGIDFSDCATNAVKIATDLVGAGELTLVHAYHVPFKALTMRTERDGSLSAGDRERVETELRREVGRWVEKSGLPLDADAVRLHEGSAIRILPGVANEMGADLICLGAHSRAWLPAAILGSTASELLTYSDFDILIAPL